VCADLRAVIGYRTLDALRQVFHRRGPLRPKLASIAYLLLLPLWLWLPWQISILMVPTARLESRTAAVSLLCACALGASALFFLGVVPECFREIGLARDQQLLRVCPISPARLLGYRMTFVILRNAPFCAISILLPVSFILRSSAFGPFRLPVILLIIAYFAWLGLLSLSVSMILLRLGNAWQLARRSGYALLFMIFFLTGSVIIFNILDPSIWTALSRSSSALPPPPWMVYVVPVLLIVSGYWLCRMTLRIWPGATVSDEGGQCRERAFSAGKRLFSLHPAWAISQKDIRTLFRNPAYRYSLMGCLLLASYCLFLHGRHPPGGSHSWGRLMIAMTYIYWIPLSFSARTVSLEYRMLGLYRLVFPDVGRLLDLKWTIQAFLNCAVAALLGVATLLSLDGNVGILDPAYYLGCVLFCVPLLTMLAIALGTFFPLFPGQ
jgi:hypothetical protein